MQEEQTNEISQIAVFFNYEKGGNSKFVHLLMSILCANNLNSDIELIIIIAHIFPLPIYHIVSLNVSLLILLV